MEKRVIIAFILSFVVLYAFRALYAPPPTGQEQQQAAQVSPPSPPKSPAEAPPSAKTEIPEPAHPADVRGEKSEDLTVDTPLYSAVVSNIGGVLKSFTLKDYKDAEGRPLELINQAAASHVGSPLAIATGDKSTDDQLAKASFAVRREGDSLTLEFAGNGLYVRKELAFDREKYLFSLKTTVTKDGKAVPYSLVWQGVFGDQSITQDIARKNAVYQSDVNAYKRVALRSLKDPQNFTSPRAGVEDQYFLAAFMFGMPEAVKVRKQEYPGPDGKAVSTLAISYSAPQDTAVRVFVGPKQRQALQQADPELSAALDLGYFGFIARPLLDILLWIHKYVGNFGWAIILLTVGLTLILFPLRLKQQVSMLKMQKIQPQMRRLQDQYKKLKASDPRRTQVQTDMMNLYKEHGVNPMGGCLPLLLQMPLLFGFYAALGYSIELRQAPWIFWIKDLSQPDPYYVIPIAMAVAMFLQQKLTPTPNVDPAQAKMMLVMPIVFTFMFLNYGSGLALYWLTSNIISVGQQIFINKYWSPQAEAKLRAGARPKEQQGT